MLDSTVAGLVSRDEQADLPAHACALPEVPACANCGARLGAGARASQRPCSLCYVDRLVHGGQVLSAD